MDFLGFVASVQIPVEFLSCYLYFFPKFETFKACWLLYEQPLHFLCVNDTV
jgi:hypothetical protein